MSCHIATLILDDFGLAQRLGDAMEDIRPRPLGLARLEIEDGSGRVELTAYYVEPPDEIALLLLGAAHGAPSFNFSRLAEKDWVGEVERSLTPVRAGRFLVHGRHDRGVARFNDFGLEIQAAMAFGTGHHGTTIGCLELSGALAQRGFAPLLIADIGTGTGILSMAAAKLWPRARIVASDIEDVAVRTARANFRANGVVRAKCIEARGFCHPKIRARGRGFSGYSLIYANILAAPLRVMAGDMARFSAKGGYLVLSGIMNHQAKSVLARYHSHGFALVEARKINGWTSLLLRKARVKVSERDRSGRR